MAETFAPTTERIVEIANAALLTIPAALRRHIEGVAILVEDFCDEETEKSLALDSPYELLGLYHGVSLDQKGTSHTADDVDRIFLYRLPILDSWCESGVSLEALVRNTLIHEIGHHFGLSDEDMDRLEAEDDDGPALE